LAFERCRTLCEIFLVLSSYYFLLRKAREISWQFPLLLRKTRTLQGKQSYVGEVRLLPHKDRKIARWFRHLVYGGRSVRSFANARRSCEQPNLSEIEKHDLGHYRFLI